MFAIDVKNHSFDVRISIFDLGSLQAAAGRHSLEAWRWAWSCVHSRSFKEGAGRHLIVPGIDMANHAFTPSASVRCPVFQKILSYGTVRQFVRSYWVRFCAPSAGGFRMDLLWGCLCTPW